MPLSSQPTYTAAILNTHDFADENNRQDLIINKILGFIFCVVVTFFYQVYQRDGYQITPIPIQEFIFFLLVALCASLASMITSHQEQTKALFQRIAIVAIALALASLASMFLQVWFQAAAYVVCMVPLYASAQTRFNHWFLKLWRRLMKRKREYSTSPIEVGQVESYGGYSV